MAIEHSENEAAPKIVDGVYFARTNFRNKDRLFGIKRVDRRQHMYVIGKTGTGKSAMLHNLITQDILNGEGLCVVDPHGDLVEDLLEMIPKERAEDVIYFNPADTDYHVGFNVLELPNPKYKHLVASGLMGIFTKIWANVWSARMEYILNNAILALLDTPKTTLLGIPRILVDKEYRQLIIGNLKDPVVKAFWVNEYEQWQEKFRNEAIAPIQNKVGQFLSTSIVRNVVGQSKSSLEIFDIMNSNKIFLVNVAKGRIGEDNSALLGAMLITKIQLSAMERVRIPEEERKDFYLYVDEFQNFATDSFAGVLSEARKYRLNLIIAHQYIGQLVTDMSTVVRDAVFGNTGTIITFRVGATDAEFLENEFEPEFTIQDIVNLPNYHIYLKLMVDGMTCRPFSALTIAPFKHSDNPAGGKNIIAMSRKKYARPREEIEKAIQAWASGTGLSSPEEAPEEERKAAVKGEANKLLKGDERVAAICDACGNEARLPFKPNPNKPVYCSSCLDKVRSGEIQPVKILRIPAADKQAKTKSALSNIGIEFEVKEVKPSGGLKKKKKRNRGPRNERPAVATNSQGEVSLGNLSSNNPRKDDHGRKSDGQTGAAKDELKDILRSGRN